METKTLLSAALGDEGFTGPSSSALRRLNAQNRRLSLRRSRTSSCSSSTASSVNSHSSVSVSCVTRETSRDDCAFHRFIVWVAVKRNTCDKMTSSERLECPLLRCRKRFPNHEAMLQHVYACEMLGSGEYWCYDCERAEKFTDSKCKRCLGHPTKRRKILSMAKNFFTSLGHKSRKDGLHHGLDDESLLPPPSYDSLHIPPQEAELLSNEIVEIDSTPVYFTPVPTIEEVPEPAFVEPTPPSTDDEMMCPVELESCPRDDPLLHWINDAAIDVNEDPSTVWHRPMLQVNTDASSEQRRMKTRSKTLAPSSSLRSTTSTASNQTTNTTVTTSTGISPMTQWSGAWTAGTGLDTSLESPISDPFDVDVFGVCPDAGKEVFPTSGNGTDDMDEDDFMSGLVSELPAELPGQPMAAPVPGSFRSDQLFLGADTAGATHVSVGANLALANEPALSIDILASVLEEPPAPGVETTSLVASMWETLQTHVSSTMAKLPLLPNNSLANQLRAMTARTIASAGLATLKVVLNGHTPTSPPDLLCFVHVVYSFSLVVHEEEAQAHCRELFSQALVYSSRFAPGTRAEYVEVARTIWQPDDADPVGLEDAEILLSQFSGVINRSGSRKGKERDDGRRIQHKEDPLVSVAQFFLDELEYSALPSNNPKPLEVLTSSLWTKHLDESNLNNPVNSSFEITVGYALNVLAHRYQDAKGFSHSLKPIHRRVLSGELPTVRRVELELLRAGHGCMDSATFFDDYAPFVRHQCDSLYDQQISGLTPRSKYYSHGIDLVESIITGIVHVENPPGSAQQEAPTSVDDIFAAMTTGFSDRDLSQFPGDASWMVDMPNVSEITPASESTASPPESTIKCEPQPKPADSTSPEEPDASAQKVESHDCCEICGYRPKGDPQWFKGSMAKHKKLQHGNSPPKIYKCPYPGCTSQYKKRPDNLRQHQLDKGHFVDGDMTRPPKKRKLDGPD